MNTLLAAAAFAIIAITLPTLTFRHIAPPSLVARVFAIWCANALLLFLLSDFLAVCLMAMLLMVLLAPSNPQERLHFFIAVFPSMPVYVTAFVPFPGINWLVLLTFWKITSFVCLFPLTFYHRDRKEQAEPWSISDVSILLYVAYTGTIIMYTIGLAGGLRFFFDMSCLFLLPYFMISRFVRTTDDLKLVMEGLLTCALILGTVALLATLKHWDFYRMKETASVFTIPDLRSGLMRIAATANTHSLGFFCTCALIVFEFLKDDLKMSRLKRMAVRIILFGGLFVTDSRGALLALVVAIAVIFYLRLKNGLLRRSVFVSLSVGAPLMMWFLTAGNNAADLDPYGSFAYRQLLMTVSLQHIADYPIFGDLSYLSDRRFLPLMQGQGIIDITNFYLQVLLAFGGVGMTIFMGIFLPSLLKLWNQAVPPAGIMETPEEQKLREGRGYLLAIILGWFALMITTSDAGFTLQQGIICAGLARAATRIKAEPRGPER